MIKTFKHKGLRELWERGSSRNVEQQYTKRVREILTAINAARITRDLDLPGYRLHELVPSRPGVWSIRAYGAWRVTFEFQNGDAYRVDLEQYH